MNIFELIKGHNKNILKLAFLILLFYFDLENCVFYVTMKTETINKSSTDIAIFEIILEFENKYNKDVFTYIYFPPYDISFYLRNVLYSNNSFMFNFSKTGAHICFTEYVLSIYYVKCSREINAEKCYTAIPTKFQQSTFFSGPKYKISFFEYNYTTCLGSN